MSLVNIHISIDDDDDHRHRHHLRWVFCPVSEQSLPGPTKGHHMFVLKDTQQATLTVVPEDKKLKPAKLPDGAKITLGSSDDTVVAVTDNGDGTGTAVAGNPGTAQINAQIIGADGTTVLAADTEDVSVVAGDVSVAGVTFGTPTDQP